MARSMDFTGASEQFVGKIDREPWMHMMADRSSEKLSRHLSQCNVELNGLPCFSAMREASLSLYLTQSLGHVHYYPIYTNPARTSSCGLSSVNQH